MRELNPGPPCARDKLRKNSKFHVCPALTSAVVNGTITILWWQYVTKLGWQYVKEVDNILEGSNTVSLCFAVCNRKVSAPFNCDHQLELN